MKTLEITLFDPLTNHNVNSWLKGSYDKETKETIERLLVENPQEILDAFYTHLSFGTGGVRGIMGVGTNRINKYTLQACTQGLANYLNQQPKTDQGHRVMIGYDSRHHSREFAIECAKVLAANQIHVYIYKEIRPTPLVSFGCRLKKCSSAIMLTASHNPGQYNGYKVYWNDGSQVLPPHDLGIIDEVNKINDISMVKSITDLNNPFIEWIDDEIDHEYLKAIDGLQLYPKNNKEQGKNLKIAYTSLHGTGITLVPKAMNAWGFSTVELVKKQIIPDGDFPTCKSPNPEDHEALQLGMETLLASKGDILIATDPDADRVGIAINHRGKIQHMDGNQLACLLLHHILEALSEQNRLPANAAFVKTIVTSELFHEICKAKDKPCFNVLTGFKYVAEKIREWENSNSFQFIFGGEDSYGYLYGTKVRDKDAVISSLLICEMALQSKLKGKTLIDLLHEIWHTHGVYTEKLSTVKFEDSKMGKEQMTKGMDFLRKNPPQKIGQINVLVLEDYYHSQKQDLLTGKAEKILLPQSDVLLFRLADESTLVIRPSGTEPKIKIYCGVVKKNAENIKLAIEEGNAHAAWLIEQLQIHLNTNYS